VLSVFATLNCVASTHRVLHAGLVTPRLFTLKNSSVANLAIVSAKVNQMAFLKSDGSSLLRF